MSLLAPPPDTIVRACKACRHRQEVALPPRDADLPARQRKRRVESFRKASSPTI